MMRRSALLLSIVVLWFAVVCTAQVQIGGGSHPWMRRPGEPSEKKENYEYREDSGGETHTSSWEPSHPYREDSGHVVIEEEDIGFVSRFSDSFIGVIIGFIMFFASFFLLFWNEGRTIKQTNSLKEIKSVVVPLPSSSKEWNNTDIVSSFGGKLVYVHGDLTVNDVAVDEEFSLRIPGALKLVREVEMYQWKERHTSSSHKKLGGGKKVRHVYENVKVWSSSCLNSSSFKSVPYPPNPTNFPVSNRTWTSSDVGLTCCGIATGIHILEDQFKNLGSSKPYSVSVNEISSSLTSVDALGRYMTTVSGEMNTIYLSETGGTPHQPHIGDCKITFSVCSPGEISLISKLNSLGDGFEPFVSRSGNKFSAFVKGEKKVEEIIESKNTENKILAYVLRVVGFLMMWVGMLFSLSPLQVLTDIIPFIGGLFSIATVGATAICSLVLSLVTIAFAWLFQRPFYAMCILGVAVVLISSAKSSQ